jgi:hypothetical protein
MNENFILVVPGIGLPNIDKKLAILRNNLTYFNNVNYKAYLFQYSLESDYLKDFKDNSKIKIVKEKGIVGDFLRNHITPELVEDFTHIIILLDDVEIQKGFSIDELLEFKNKFKIDILSCSYTKNSKSPWNVMKSADNCYGRITNFAELIFNIMDIPTYIKYYQYIIPENPWMWGLDLSLYQLGFRIGIIDKMSVRHYFGGEGISPDSLPSPYKGIQFFYKKFDIKQIIKPATLQYIRPTKRI